MNTYTFTFPSDASPDPSGSVDCFQWKTWTDSSGEITELKLPYPIWSVATLESEALSVKFTLNKKLNWFRRLVYYLAGFKYKTL